MFGGVPHRQILLHLRLMRAQRIRIHIVDGARAQVALELRGVVVLHLGDGVLVLALGQAPHDFELLAVWEVLELYSINQILNNLIPRVAHVF
mgnify:CR=1 FL=1